MKKNFLLTVLLLVVGFSVSDGLKAQQCLAIPNQIYSIYYSLSTRGDVVFEGRVGTSTEQFIGFTHGSAIINNYSYYNGVLKFKILDEFMPNPVQKTGCLDIGVLYRNGYESIIRIYLTK